MAIDIVFVGASRGASRLRQGSEAWSRVHELPDDDHAVVRDQQEGGDLPGDGRLHRLEKRRKFVNEVCE